MKRKIFIFGFLLYFIDQLLKQLIIMNISYHEIVMVIPNFFYLTSVKNTGGAWSILTGNIWFLLLIGFFCLVALFYYLKKKNTFSFLEIIIFSFLFGGILGNFTDRIFYHGVIDYLGFIFGNYHFPIFNLADILIVVGGCLFFFKEVRGEKNGIRSY